MLTNFRRADYFPNNNSILYTARNYLTYYDESIINRLLKDKNNYLYRPYGKDYSAFISDDDIELLIRAVFIQRKLRIRMCAAFRIDSDGNFSAVHHHKFGISFNDCMPNIHINDFCDVGSYALAIKESLRARDYTRFGNLCLGACGTLEIADSAALSLFMTYLYTGNRCNNKCIELPNGSVDRPDVAIKWIKANKEFFTFQSQYLRLR